MRLQVLHLPTPSDGSDPRFALVIDEAPELAEKCRDVRYDLSDAAEYIGASGLLIFGDTVEVL